MCPFLGLLRSACWGWCYMWVRFGICLKIYDPVGGNVRPKLGTALHCSSSCHCLGKRCQGVKQVLIMSIWQNGGDLSLLRSVAMLSPHFCQGLMPDRDLIPNTPQRYCSFYSLPLPFACFSFSFLQYKGRWDFSLNAAHVQVTLVLCYKTWWHFNRSDLVFLF